MLKLGFVFLDLCSYVSNLVLMFIFGFVFLSLCLCVFEIVFFVFLEWIWCWIWVGFVEGDENLWVCVLLFWTMLRLYCEHVFTFPSLCLYFVFIFIFSFNSILFFLIQLKLKF